MPKRSSTPTLSKLSRPRLFGAVPRERLFGALDGARDIHPGICVVGPPGAGKTTLVASWLEARKRGGVWYQVDGGDDDLATFFHYLGLAAAPFARRGQRALPALTPEYLPDVKGFSRRFFRELFARLPTHSTLVLDNYQEVDADHAFHELVSDAIDEVPAGSHLIVVSRADPPACYARLKANRAVAIIDWDDLRLTFDETTAIGRLRDGIDDATLHALHARCDGWAAGLVLMLAERGGVENGLAPATTAPEAVFDYFAGTLFDRAPDALRRMLLSVAFLPYVRADWATELSGEADAAKLLDTLYRRHFFTQRRPGADGAYQFHALFQGFLRSRARHVLPEANYEDLVRRSADLLRAAHEVEAAFELDCELANWDVAAALLLDEAESMIAAGRWQTFTQCVSRLPGAQLDAKPWLGYWLGVALTPVDQERARRVLEAAYAEFESRGDKLGQMLSAAGVLDAVGLALHDISRLSPWIDRLAAFIGSDAGYPSVDVELRVLSSMLVPCTYSRPDHSALAGITARVTELLQADGEPNLRVWSAVGLLGYAHVSGNIQFGDEVIRIVTPIIDSTDVSATNAVRCHGSIGYCLYVKCRYDAAMASYRKARTIARENGLVAQDFMIATWRGFCEWRMGNVATVDRTLAELRALPVPEASYSTATFVLLEAASASEHGRLADAVALATNALEQTMAAGVELGRITFRIILIDLLLQSDDAHAARRRLDELERIIDENRLMWCFRPVMLTHRFLVHLRAAEQEDATRCAVQALQEAGRYGILVYMRWAGTALPHLCAYALDRDIEVGFVRDMIREYALKPPASAPDQWPWSIRVRTLGQFDLALKDQPPTFTRKAPKRLLQLLKTIIAFGAVDVPAQKLVDAMWPDEDGDAGAHSLQVSVTRLRKLLGSADAVHVLDGRLSLNPDLCWVDALVFDRLLADGGGSIEEAERACALYQGAFLPGDTDAPWAVTIRERLRARHVEQVDRIGRHFEGASQWDRAASWYQRGIDSDPLMESFYQGVMRCYAQTGRRAEALSTYRRLRQTLSVVLGIEPSAATKALYGSLYSA